MVVLVTAEGDVRNAYLLGGNDSISELTNRVNGTDSHEIHTKVNLSQSLSEIKQEGNVISCELDYIMRYSQDQGVEDGKLTENLKEYINKAIAVLRKLNDAF